MVLHITPSITDVSRQNLRLNKTSIFKAKPFHFIPSSVKCAARPSEAFRERRGYAKLNDVPRANLKKANTGRMSAWQPEHFSQNKIKLPLNQNSFAFKLLKPLTHLKPLSLKPLSLKPLSLKPLKPPFNFFKILMPLTLLSFNCL